MDVACKNLTLTRLTVQQWGTRVGAEIKHKENAVAFKICSLELDACTEDHK
jgi:hypothetical protein